MTDTDTKADPKNLGVVVPQDSTSNEQSEQRRISRETMNPFDGNRVEHPGTGVDGRVKINRDHWGE